MSDRTQVIGHPIRDRADARELERALQGFIDGIQAAGGQPDGQDAYLVYEGIEIPPWARGVRVESADNGAQHILVATEHRGH